MRMKRRCHVRDFSLILAAGLSLVVVSAAETFNGKRLRARKTTPEAFCCRITNVDTMYPSRRDEIPKEEIETACIPIFNATESDDLLQASLPHDFVGKHSDTIEQGRLFVSIIGATVQENQLVLDKNATIQVIPDPLRHIRNLQVGSTSMGIKTLAVFRIATLDSKPMFSRKELKKGLFRSDGVSIRSQLDACSFGQLKLQLAPVGVTRIKIQQNVSDFNDGSRGSSLVAAATKEIKRKLKIDDLSSIADKVFMCLPPGTGNYAARAGVNHWRAHFNNEWCLSLTATMHEIGHLMGLQHSSSNGKQFEDYTGYMAAGYPNANWPQKCYNGHKSWLLGWYSSHHKWLVPTMRRGYPKRIKLAAFIDYDRIDDGDTFVVANVEGEYFLQYNVAKSFNADVEDERDKVTITFTERGKRDSNRLGGLTAGERFVVPDFKGTGQALVIEACTSLNGGKDGLDMMEISVGMDESACGFDSVNSFGSGTIGSEAFGSGTIGSGTHRSKSVSVPGSVGNIMDRKTTSSNPDIV